VRERAHYPDTLCSVVAMSLIILLLWIKTGIHFLGFLV
jgi:hypothetical protein